MFRGSTNTAVVLEGSLKHPDDGSYVEFFTKFSVDIICTHTHKKKIEIEIINETNKSSMMFYLHQNIPALGAIGELSLVIQGL